MKQHPIFKETAERLDEVIKRQGFGSISMIARAIKASSQQVRQARTGSGASVQFCEKVLDYLNRQFPKQLKGHARETQPTYPAAPKTTNHDKFRSVASRLRSLAETLEDPDFDPISKAEALGFELRFLLRELTPPQERLPLSMRKDDR